MPNIRLRCLLTFVLAGTGIVISESSLTVVIIDGNVRIGFASEKFIPDFPGQPIGEVLSFTRLMFKQTGDLFGVFSSLLQSCDSEGFPETDSSGTSFRKCLL